MTIRARSTRLEFVGPFFEIAKSAANSQQLQVDPTILFNALLVVATGLVEVVGHAVRGGTRNACDDGANERVVAKDKEQRRERAALLDYPPDADVKLRGELPGPPDPNVCEQSGDHIHDPSGHADLLEYGHMKLWSIESKALAVSRKRINCCCVRERAE